MELGRTAAPWWTHGWKELWHGEISSSTNKPKLSIYSWALSACSQLMFRYYCFCFPFRSQNDLFSREINFFKKAIGFWESRMRRGLKHLCVWTIKAVEFGVWHNSWHPWFHTTAENLFRHRNLHNRKCLCRDINQDTANVYWQEHPKITELKIFTNNWRYLCAGHCFGLDRSLQKWPLLHSESLDADPTEIQGNLSIQLITLCGRLRGLCYRQVSTWHKC